MRRSRILIVAATTGLLLTACGSAEPAGGAQPPGSVPPTAPPTTAAPSTSAAPTTSVVAPEAPLAAVGGRVYEAGWELAADHLGLSLTDFETQMNELGFGPIRIEWENGEFIATEDDLRPGRVDVAVETRAGVRTVIDAYVETDPDTGDATQEATIVGTYEGVEFYPACGNETLTYEGVVWHQVQEFEYPDVYDRAARGNRENPPESVGEVQGFAPRVVAPGPGDDVGTLVVWSDGVAYFVADSGDLTAWLVQEELTYEWVC